MSSTRSTCRAGNAPRSIPEKPIYDIPGYPRIDAAELIDRLAEQAAPFAPVYHLGQAVEALAARRRRVRRRDRGRGAGRGARRHHRGRRRRVRPEPPAARRHRGVRGQERLLSRAAARGFPRQARRHRRRRRFGGRLGARRWPRSPSGSWSSIAAPNSAPRRESAARLQQLADDRPDRAGHPLSAARARGRAAASSTRSIVADLDGDDAAAARPTRCCRSSAWRWISARSPQWGLDLEQQPYRRRSGDLRDLAPGHLRDRRHRDLSGQAEADPLRLRRGGDGGACDLPAGPSRRGAAFRIFDDARACRALTGRHDRWPRLPTPRAAVDAAAAGRGTPRRCAGRRGSAIARGWLDRQVQRRRWCRCPGSRSISTRPPCSSMKLLTSDRPSPAPDCARLRVAALEFLEDARLIARAECRRRCRRRRAAIVAALALAPSSRIVPPGGVNLIAFEIRLNSACLSRRSSAVDRADIGRAVELELEVLACAPARGSAPARSQQLADVDLLGLQHHVAGLDRREVEDVVDQRQQPVRAVEDAAAVVELARVQRRRNTGWSGSRRSR